MTDFISESKYFESLWVYQVLFEAWLDSKFRVGPSVFVHVFACTRHALRLSVLDMSHHVLSCFRVLAPEPGCTEYRCRSQVTISSFPRETQIRVEISTAESFWAVTNSFKDQAKWTELNNWQIEPSRVDANRFEAAEIFLVRLTFDLLFV